MHKISSSTHIGDHLVIPAWKSALYHFRRILIECGSPIEVEHSQRLGLLFSKNVGCDRDVELWASLFDADDVPTTSMMLKALVVHNKWQTAIQLLQRDCDHPNTADLGELLTQYLLKKNLVHEAFRVVELLASSSPQATLEVHTLPVTPPKLTSSSALISQAAIDDSVGLATDPTYVPHDERCDMCGIASAVLRNFPRNDQWEDAVNVLSVVYPHARGQTKLKILETMVARCTYGGHQHARAAQLATENAESANSAVIQRCLFFGALETGRMDDAMTAFALLSKMGTNQIPQHTFLRFCNWVLEFQKDRDRMTNRRCATLIAAHLWACPDKTTQMALRDFVMQFGERARATKPVLRSDLPHLSVSELDTIASRLVQSGEWQEALSVIAALSLITPHSTEEQIVSNAVKENLNDWQQALLFFS